MRRSERLALEEMLRELRRPEGGRGWYWYATDAEYDRDQGRDDARDEMAGALASFLDEHARIDVEDVVLCPNGEPFAHAAGARPAVGASAAGFGIPCPVCVRYNERAEANAST